MIEIDHEFGLNVLWHAAQRRVAGQFKETALATFFYSDATFCLQASQRRVWHLGRNENIHFGDRQVLGVLVNRGNTGRMSGTGTGYNALPEFRPWLSGELPGISRIGSASGLGTHFNWTTVSRLLSDPQKRVVRSGDELLDVLAECLKRAESELQGELPAASTLWNEVNKGKWRPKTEEDLSDYLARFLKKDLSDRGIVANREVQIQRRLSKDGQPGERTDIYVDCVPPSGSAVGSRISAIIEVKGCWNRPVRSATEDQLVARYLLEHKSSHGIYVVGWYKCCYGTPPMTVGGASRMGSIEITCGHPRAASPWTIR
ncbi:MAG: hypothetical protein R2762_04940 [Bryobacteraceae bacterium]